MTDKDGEKYVAMKNEMALSRQNLELKEAQVVRLALSCIEISDEGFYECKFDALNLSESLGFQPNNASRDFKNIGKNLVRQTLDIKNDAEKWEYIPWFRRISYDKGILTICFNDLMNPYLLQLKNHYLKYKLEITTKYTSVYSLRIYEIIKAMYGEKKGLKNEFKMKIEELREMTNTEKKFERFSSFKDKVLDKAVSEINEHSEYSISYKLVKLSRTYNEIIFYINEKFEIKPSEKLAVDDGPEIPGQLDLNNAYKIKEMIEAKGFSCNIDQAQQLFTAYDCCVNNEFLKRLEYTSLQDKYKKIKSPIGYLLTIAKKDIDLDAIPKDSPKRKPRRTKAETIEPMSESREQAYIDMEVEFAEDLWPDLPVNEESNAEIDPELLKEYQTAVNQINEILANPAISSLVGISTFDNDATKMEETLEKLKEIASQISDKNKKNKSN